MRAQRIVLLVLTLTASVVWTAQRPTLGPQPGPKERPSLHGARTWFTTSPGKLTRVRTLFVQRIENQLSQKLIEGIGKMGRFRVVERLDDADAVVRGTCFESRRLKLVHTEVYISDRNSGAAIWQDSFRLPYNPPPLAEVVNETALAIIVHLSEGVREAERR